MILKEGEGLMVLRYKSGEDVSDSVSLLISILVRYPQVGSINFDPDKQALKFNFIFAQEFEENDLQKFKTDFINSLETYNLLEGKKPREILLTYQRGENLTILEVERDVDTLSHEEISLIIALVEETFLQTLVTEKNEYFLEEDLQMQEEMIGHMLENLKGNMQGKRLIAFREEGRVLVFNK